jgi:dihydrofolate reductase
MDLVLVAALAKNNVIGKDGDMPWRKDPQMKNFRSADMKHFKELTTGYSVIMGRVTYGSIPKKFRPLPGRLNVVLTSQDLYQDEDVVVAHSLEEALASLKDETKRPEGYDYTKIFPIGGSRIYQETLNLADKLELTYLDHEYEGDTFFPEINQSKWEIENKVDHKDEEFNINYKFVTLVRKK